MQSEYNMVGEKVHLGQSIRRKFLKGSNGSLVVVVKGYVISWEVKCWGWLQMVCKFRSGDYHIKENRQSGR